MMKSTGLRVKIFHILFMFILPIHPGLLNGPLERGRPYVQVTGEASYSYAYQDEIGNIWIRLVDEPEPFQVTFRRETDGHYSIPKWSPDGTKLGYLQKPAAGQAYGSPATLFIYDVPNRTERSYPTDISDFGWSPNSQEIVYARSFAFEYSYSDGLTTFQKADGIWVLDIVSGATRELIPAADFPLVEAASSPSGRYILYLELLDPNRNLWNNKVFDREQPDAPVALVEKGDCAWSPVEDRLACTDSEGGNYPSDASKLPCQTRILSPLGEVMARLPAYSQDTCDISPVWSPDGRQLLILARRFMTPNNLGDVADLYNFEPQTRVPLENLPMPDYWTPDSQWLQYSGWSSESAAFLHTIRNLQTGEERNLLGLAVWQPEAVVDNQPILQDVPAERLYFLQQGDIYVMEPPDMNQVRITSDGNYKRFEVAPGGEYILAVEKINQTHWQHNLDVIHVQDRMINEIGEVTILRNQFPSISPDGSKLLYTIADSPAGRPDGKTYITDLAGNILAEKSFLMQFPYWGANDRIYYFRANRSSDSPISFECYYLESGDVIEMYSSEDLYNEGTAFFPDSVYYNPAAPFFAVWSKPLIQTDSGELVFLHLDGSYNIQRQRLYSCRMDNRIGVWDSRGEMFLFSEGQSDQWSSPAYAFVTPDRFQTLAVNRPAYLNPSISPSHYQIAYVTVQAGLGFYDLQDRSYEQVIADQDPSLLGSAPGDCGGPMPKGYAGASAEPIWSPSGNWLVFTRGAGFNLLEPSSRSYQTFSEGANFRWAPGLGITPTISSDDVKAWMAEKEVTIVYLSQPNFSPINLPSITGVGFEEQAAIDLMSQIRSQVDAGSASPEAVSGFLRLKLQEDVLETAYHANLVMVNDLNDTTVTLFGIVLDIWDVSEAMLEPLGAIGEKILEKIREKLSLLLNDWIQSHDEISPIWQTASTILLDHMEGEITPRTGLGEAGALTATIQLADSFVTKTQPILTRAVGAAQDQEAFEGADDQTDQGTISERLAEFNASTNRRHEVLTQSKDILDAYATAWYPMLIAGTPGQAVVAVNQLVALCTDLYVQTEVSLKNTRDMRALLTDSQQILFPHAELVQQSLPASGAASAPGLMADNDFVDSPIRANRSLMEQPIKAQQSNYQDDYLRLLEAVQRQDEKAIELLLPEFNAAESALAAELEVSRVRMTGSMDLEQRASIDALASAYDLQVIGLMLSLAGVLENLEDETSQSRFESQGNAVLQSIDAYAKALESLSVSDAVRIGNQPSVAIIAIKFPEIAQANLSTTLLVRLLNPGVDTLEGIILQIASADEVLFSKEMEKTLQGDTVDEFVLEVSLNKLEGIQFLRVLVAGEVTDIQPILLSSNTSKSEASESSEVQPRERITVSNRLKAIGMLVVGFGLLAVAVIILILVRRKQ